MKKNIIATIIMVVVLTTVITGCATTVDTTSGNENTAVVTTTEYESETTVSEEVETTETPSETVETVSENTSEQEDITEEPSVTPEPEVINNIELGYADLTIDELDAICNVKADVQTDIKKCYIDTTTAANPYDVIYNYGDEYNKLIAECDWSLVFDVNYYISEFPCLALLYHNDADLLLQHFQTAGIHEGRQGSANFNAHAFYGNSDIDGADIQTSTAYIYYMLHADDYQNINTTTSDEYEIKTIYGCIGTALQKQELDDINMYRAEVYSDNVEMIAELNALANYRAYVNATENWIGHRWMYITTNHDFIMNTIHDKFNAVSYAENTVDGLVYNTYSDPYTYAYKYRISESHYKAMVDSKYHYVGVSNVYYSDITNFNNGVSEDYTNPEVYPYMRSQFELFIN